VPLKSSTKSIIIFNGLGTVIFGMRIANPSLIIYNKIIYNNEHPSPKLLENYMQEGEHLVGGSKDGKEKL
jgi:hypothetical protein